MAKSTDYYNSHPEALKIKNAYAKKYDKKPRQKKKRAALNAANHKAGTYGNGDGKDVSHKKGGGTFMEAQSKNRARKGKA